MTHVIGIDHGNGNMKTENCVFPCGYTVQDIEPNAMYARDVIEYKGKFYSLSPNRAPYQTDKTTNEDAFVLTLFAIAKELCVRDVHLKAFVGKDVILAVGLPPAHYEKQAKSFREYFMKRVEHGVNFKYNGKTFSFYVKDTLVFPQDYAAAITYMGDVLADYAEVGCYCVDIGDGTTDVVELAEGVPVKATMASLVMGMSKLRSTIRDDVINDIGAEYALDDKTIEAFWSGKKIAIDPAVETQIKEKIASATMKFTQEVVNLLRGKVTSFKTRPTIFCGGGVQALKDYLPKTGAFGVTYFIENIHANAVGYQELAKMQLGIE